MLIESFCNIRVDFFIFGTMAWLFSTICIAYCIIFFFKTAWLRGGANQYLNCWGNAGKRVPHQELASPHWHLASPHRDLASPHRDSHIALKTFFWSFLDFGAKNSSIFGKDLFFLVFTRFRGRKNIISTKVLLHSECVWSRLQKRPTVQNFTV